MPLRVGDSFVADRHRLRARRSCTPSDRGVDLISEALGTLSPRPSTRPPSTTPTAAASRSSRAPPTRRAATTTCPRPSTTRSGSTRSRTATGTIVEAANGLRPAERLHQLRRQGVGRDPVDSCSSEATGRAGGPHRAARSRTAKNLIDRGLLTPYPGPDRAVLRRGGAPAAARARRERRRPLGRPVLVRTSTRSRSCCCSRRRTSASSSARASFPTQRRAGTSSPATVAPTRRRCSTSTDDDDPARGRPLRQPALVRHHRPARTPEVRRAPAPRRRCARRAASFDWRLEVGCGVQPLDFRLLDAGRRTAAPRSTRDARAAGSRAPAAKKLRLRPERADRRIPDAHTVTLRLRVVDALGNLGEDRRTVAIHHDPTLALRAAPARRSGESSPALADVNRDGVLDIVHGGGDGAVHALDGATRRRAAGLPGHTEPLPVHASPAYASGEVPIPHEAVIGADRGRRPRRRRPRRDRGGLRSRAASTSSTTTARAAPGFPVRDEPGLLRCRRTATS